MQKKEVILDFGSVILEAELFDSKISEKFIKHLPYTINLTQWGDEVYGSIDINLGEENPIPKIPPGGIAYTNTGNYLCVFFGQTPAWPVEYIGQIQGDGWEKLAEVHSFDSLTIRLKT